MPDTVRTLAALQALLADNVTEQISPQDIRDFLVSAYRIVIAKSADESVSSATTGTTLQDDNDLVFAIGANEVWVVRYVLFPMCADATVDIKTNITVPTGATGRRGQFGAINSATITDEFRKAQQFDLDGSTALSAGVTDSDSVDVPLYLDAYIENGANAGNVTLQWAQQNSSAVALIMKKGSMLEAQQVNN